MKTGLVIVLALVFSARLSAQRCDAYTYQQAELKNNPSLVRKIREIESFTKQKTTNYVSVLRGEEAIIKIPVVVHILYHTPEEKISDAVVMSQLEVLNKCFRRRNADSVNTPDRFWPYAADCGIEFQLATSDIRRKSTTGIIRKYTPITKWKMDDKMKFSANMGDDAWDAGSYLNIWVCQLDRLAGYASFPGGDAAKDGLVIDTDAFGTKNAGNGYDQGKTAVHEAGHWLGLKHLWGDENCGDDGVDDTPKQASYTIGCPNSIRVTCNNGPHGDMYMNYMDFTNDACTNMFTLGQKMRMRALFEAGGARYSLLSSKGLNAPLIFEIPTTEEDPKWLHPKLYPNPASSTLTLDLAYDFRWVGKTIQIYNMAGQIVLKVAVTSKLQKIDINKLQPGVYTLAAKKEDGESIRLQFVKL